MGTSSVSVTYSPVGGFTGTITPATLAVTTSTTNDITIGACDVSIPTGIDSSGAPTGNFSGTTYNTATNAAGFISQAVDYTTTTQNCAAQGTVILERFWEQTRLRLLLRTRLTQPILQVVVRLPTTFQSLQVLLEKLQSYQTHFYKVWA